MKPTYEIYIPSNHNPEDARPRSMDAYLCPSLIDGKRVPYNGPKPQCTGYLKDGKTLSN
jgi:hypothetical protein